MGLFTKRNKRIRDLESKIHNRDILIKNQQEQIENLEDENKILYSEKKELYETLFNIKKLAVANKYGNEKAFFDKIKELTSNI